mmetsp:Transcript_5128/g.16957  ORF Transcript_5128/g.16957 Transcript_5128/m.16957 type:complete len:243 (+) Transcript_5128:1709-2437(+)
MMGGKAACCSVVSQSRKSGCGSSDEMSFSSWGTQCTTRCRFFKHSQWPLLAASRTRLSAVPVVWPPIGSAWYLPGITRAARSSNSWSGAAPAVVIIRMGCAAVESSWMCGSAEDMGESESTLSTREMKSVHAGCRRSGRSAWMKRMRWNGVIESGTWLGNSASARSALAQRSHSRWPTSSFCRSAGSAIASIWKAAWFSCAAQGGSWPPVAVPPLRIIEPVKTSHSPSPKCSGWSMCTRCMP